MAASAEGSGEGTEKRRIQDTFSGDRNTVCLHVGYTTEGKFCYL